MNFKLTYATMFNPPAEMHTHFDAALAELNALVRRDPRLSTSMARTASPRSTTRDAVRSISAASSAISRSPLSMM